MSDTGWKSPAATGSHRNEWTNPSYAYANDGIYATCSADVDKDEQDFYNFNLAIHQSATINGIEVQIKARPVGSQTPYFVVRLSWNGGSSWTSYKDVGSFYSERYKSVGGPTNTWGRTWSPAPISQFDNSKFRVEIRNDGSHGTAYACCDHVQVKVYYTLASSSSVSVSASVTKSSSSLSSMSVTKSSSSLSSSSISGSKSSESLTKSSESLTKSSVSLSVSSSSLSLSSSSISATKSSSSYSSLSVCSSWVITDTGNTVLNLSWSGGHSINLGNYEVDSVRIVTNKKIDVQRLQNRQPIIYELGTSWKTINVTLNSSATIKTQEKLECLRTITEIMTLTMYYSDGVTQAEQFNVRVDPTARSYYNSGHRDAGSMLEMVFYEAAAG